jgi:uncharacterized membrane protein YfcA
MTVTLTGGQELLLVLAGLGAGLVNGAAGGGTLVSFPALLAVGYPALTANVTSTVGIWPGYLGGVAGFRREVAAQRDRLRSLAVTAVAGAVVGGILLLTTPGGDFRSLVPYLLLFSCLLFAAQPWLASRLRAVGGRRGGRGADQEGPGDGQGNGPGGGRAGEPGGGRAGDDGHAHLVLLHGGTFIAAVYGSYFGAGLGVVLLAVLGLATAEPLKRVNGLRSVLALIVNTVALVIFVAHAHVAWSAAGLMDGSALVGGYVGARIARRIPTVVLRSFIVVVGLVTALYLLVD